jgi:hypothetical protein
MIGLQQGFICNMTGVGLRRDSDSIGLRPAGRRVRRLVSLSGIFLTRFETRDVNAVAPH